MEVPITRFRKDIFSLVGQALEGEEVWLVHKGQRLKIVPEGPVPSRLSRITPMEIFVDPNFDMNDPAFRAEWMADMQKEWEKDWAEIGPPAPTDAPTE